MWATGISYYVVALNFDRADQSLLVACSIFQSAYFLVLFGFIQFSFGLCYRVKESARGAKPRNQSSVLGEWRIIWACLQKLVRGRRKVSTKLQKLFLSTCVGAMWRISKSTSKIVLCLYLKGVKFSARAGVGWREALGHAARNLSTWKRERASAQWLSTPLMCVARSIILWCARVKNRNRRRVIICCTGLCH